MVNQLESIRKHTRISADSAEFEDVLKYKPTDITTNPAKIFQACENEKYKKILQQAIDSERSSNLPIDQKVETIIEHVTVLFGAEILKHIPGKVSTEVDATLSFFTEGMVTSAMNIVRLYREAGVSTDRFYIKLPATWEGIQAAKKIKLNHSSVNLNMTLVFNLLQTAVCAEIGADIISPFVGRITDYYKNVKGVNVDSAHQEPGVIDVQKMYSYLKKYGYKAELMGASVRKGAQATALCGLDALTLPPSVLDELAKTPGETKPFPIFEGIFGR